MRSLVPCQAKTPEEKIAATAAMEAAKELKKAAQAEKLKEAHLFAKVRRRCGQS